MCGLARSVRTGLFDRAYVLGRHCSRAWQGSGTKQATAGGRQDLHDRLGLLHSTPSPRPIQRGYPPMEAEADACNGWLNEAVFLAASVQFSGSGANSMQRVRRVPERDQEADTSRKWFQARQMAM